MNGLSLLPCKKDTCQECATDHDLEEPHNARSLYYQYKFYAEHGRWPKWSDAIKHCSAEIKNSWKKELKKLGAWDKI